MEHDLQNYRATLLCVPSYCASPIFISSVGWQVEWAGHVLVDKSSNANTVVLVVGCVSERRLFVTPDGNYQTNQFSDISIAKFLFLIGRPDDTPFAEDFDKAMEYFIKIQNQRVSTPKRLNFIVTDGPNKNLRFTWNVFEKRVCFLFG